jgi:hypothetical protein
MKHLVLTALVLLPFLVACAPAATLTPLATATPRPTDTPPPPTATLSPTATPQPTATPRPTETFTPAPTATRTATPVPTATSTPATETSVVFNDDFSSSNCALSTVDAADHKYGCENGEYSMLSKAGNYTWWTYYRDQYDNAVIQVDARVPSGDAGVNYGIAFRISSDGNKFYRFNLTPDGRYSLYSYDRTSKWTSLIPYTASDAVKTGAAGNRLKVITQGEQIAVYVNDQFLDSVTDSTLTKGMVGFVIGTQNPNGQATFDNLTISKINRPLALPPPKARPPTPTPRPAIPPGMGGIVVDDFCGYEVYLDIVGKLYTIPVDGQVIIHLPPGHYPVSATAGGRKLMCGGGGCSLDVLEGQYIPYPYCAR